MSNRRILQAPEQGFGDRRRRPAQRQWSIWDWFFPGYYQGG